MGITALWFDAKGEASEPCEITASAVADERGGSGKAREIFVWADTYTQPFEED